jgi:hypothetical protein
LELGLVVLADEVGGDRGGQRGGEADAGDHGRDGTMRPSIVEGDTSP